MSPYEFRIVNYANECLLQLTHRNAANNELGISKRKTTTTTNNNMHLECGERKH